MSEPDPDTLRGLGGRQPIAGNAPTVPVAALPPAPDSASPAPGAGTTALKISRSRGMDSASSAFKTEINIYLRAGYPILYVVTPEEDRAIDLIESAIKGDSRLKDRPLYLWSISRGLCNQELQPINRQLQDPSLILPHILGDKAPGVYILEDFHAYLDQRSHSPDLVVRQLRDLASAAKSARKTVVILSPVLTLPAELEKDVVVIDLDPPDEAELVALVTQMAEENRDNPRLEINLDGGGVEKIVKALSGLTYAEAENALAKLLVSRGRLDPADVDALHAEKEQIVRKSDVLEYFSSPEKFGNIGGLQNLKTWLERRALAFTELAQLEGLDAPRGILLVGVPGCGKSLCAKAVARQWDLPLLKFELGRVFGSMLGESESKMRNALKLAEALSPCVLWVDEIEKGLAGSRGQGDNDSGVTRRVFGSFLTWMSDKQKPVFVVATANDIDSLPDEFLRKGRFDEIFFVDLPHPQERADILAVHLSRRGKDYREFELGRLAGEPTRGFSGAELEAVINDAIFASLAANERLANSHLAEAISTTRPLSASQGEKIMKLRQRAGGWKQASPPPPAVVSGAAIEDTQVVRRKKARVFQP